MSQINTHNLAKMASEIASKFPETIKKSKNNLKHSPQDVDQIMVLGDANCTIKQAMTTSTTDTLNFKEDIVENLASLPKIENPIISSFIPDVYSIYGYTLPKNTLYLIIILGIIGLFIWYFMTGKKNKKTKKIEDN